MGATPKMNRSAKGGVRSSPHYGGEGVLIHPPHQGVCGRHGREEQCVTSGGLARSPCGNGVSRPMCESERVSDAFASSRTAEQYQKHGESHVTGQPATELGRGRQPAKTVGKG